MNNGFEIGEEHRDIIEDAEADYGFDVVSWEELTGCVEGVVREVAFVEGETDYACCAEEEGYECMPAVPCIHYTTYSLLASETKIS